MVGLALERDLQPAPFDVVLALRGPDQTNPELSDDLARQLLATAVASTGARVLSLAAGADDISTLSAAYDIAQREDPTIDERLHIEVDLVPREQQQSVLDAHRLDGAVIRV